MEGEFPEQTCHGRLTHDAQQVRDNHDAPAIILMALEFIPEVPSKMLTLHLLRGHRFGGHAAGFHSQRLIGFDDHGEERAGVQAIEDELL